MATKKKTATKKPAAKPAPAKPEPAFWLVWRDGYNSTPHRKHTSEGEAEREAERLAALHPGEKFYALPASRFALAEIRPVDWHVDSRVDDNEVPF